MPALTPIHIQHVLLSLQPGGLENGVVNIVNGLDPARFRSSVCCLREAGQFAERIQAPGAQIHEVGLRGGLSARAVFKMAQHFARTQTDIVHTRNAEAFFYGMAAAKLAGVKGLIHSEHGRVFDDRPIRFTLQRVLSNHASAIFAVSNKLKQDLIHHIRIPGEKIEVLYNGVDLSRFDMRDQAAARALLGISAGQFVIGSVGRLVPVKNYALLMRAVARLDGVHLVLVGDGPERASLERLKRDLKLEGRVTLPGHRSDIAELIGGFDVFALTSLNEGMSNTLLEAMAGGVAVVASDVGGNREIVRNGIDGMLFDSDDESALVGIFETLVRDRATKEKFGAAARRRVMDTFDLRGMLERYSALYSGVHSLGRNAA